MLAVYLAVGDCLLFHFSANDALMKVIHTYRE